MRNHILEVEAHGVTPVTTQQLVVIQLIWTDLKDGTRCSQLIGPTGEERINHINGPYYKDLTGDWAAENEGGYHDGISKSKSIRKESPRSQL